jgi:hypothetical protein
VAALVLASVPSRPETRSGPKVAALTRAAVHAVVTSNLRGVTRMTRTVRKRPLLATMALLALLGAFPACSSATSSNPAEEGLKVSFAAEAGAEVQEATLKCGPVSATGFLVGRAEGLCGQLQGMMDVFEEEHQVCTEVYGGPETARVSGRLFGKEVDATLGRSDGCLIDQWDRLSDLLEPGAMPGAGAG